MGGYEREKPAGLVGRAAELGALDDRSTSPGVIVIVGPPGVGKSTLLAAYVSATDRDIPVIDLSEVGSIADALMEVAAALDLPVPSSSTQPERSEALGQAIARTETDLAFDNAEHILSPLLETLEVWTRLAPDARFYVTTRRRPQVAATVTVAPLGVPASDALETVAASDAYRLFADRACKSAPDFELTAANAADVAQLLRCLEGLPLAVRLAADRLAIMDARTMLARLKESGDVLGDQSDDDPRHRTLRAAVNWSWELLDENDQRALAQLSAIEGSFDAVTGSAVIQVADCDPLGALSRLVDQSLVAADDVDGRRRLRLLTSVREFARRRASELAEAHGARRRLVEYLGERASAWVSAARLDTKGPELEEIRAARTQLRQCVTAVTEEGEPIEPGVIQCALALSEIHRIEGAPAGWSRSLQRLVDLADAAQIDETLAGNLRLRLGDALREALHLQESRAVFEALAERARQQGLVALQAEALGEASFAAYMEHELADSRRLLESAEAVEVDDQQLAGKLWLERGRLDYIAGERSEALEALRHALGAARRAGDHRTETFALQNLASLHSDLGNHPKAHEFARQAVARHRSRGAHLHLGWALNNLGALEIRTGELESAREHFVEAFAILSRCGAASKAAVVVNLAIVAREAGDAESVERIINEAIALAEVEGLNDILASGYLILGASLWSTGHVTRALSTLEHQRSLFEALDSPPHTVNFFVLEGVLRAYDGDVDGAEECLRRAQQEIDELGGDDLLGALVELNKGHIIISRWRSARAEGRSEDQTKCLFELLAHARVVDLLVEDSAAQSEGLRYSVQMWRQHLPPIVETMLTTAGDPSNETSLLMLEEQHAFRPPGGEWTDLSRSDTRWTMLREFARHPHTEVSDSELMEAVWPGEVIMTDAANNRIYVSISKLRKAGLHSRLARGDAGYVLECDVSWVSV